VALMLAGLVGVVIPNLALGGNADEPTPLARPTSSPSPSASASPTPAPEEPSKPELEVDDHIVAAGPKPVLPWPSSGQALVTVAGTGRMGRSGGSGAVPIASIVKVMTAYTVLRDHPLSPGASGSRITITQAEADAYEEQKADLQSVVVVEAGEKLSERDALKGLLIASGDNLAQILARWDAGSVPALVARMNHNARRLGMSDTSFADPSGLSSASVSTAADLVKLAPAAMSNPTLAALVGTRSAGIPLNPGMKNYNSLLGRHGVYGIKTGSTTAAGGCLLFAARTSVDGRRSTIYGAVLGVPGDRSAILSNARDAADALVVRAGESLHRITVLRAGEPVASYVDAHGTTVELTVRKNVTLTGWSGQVFRVSLVGARRIGKPVRAVTVRTPAGRTLTEKLVPRTQP
jgi:serine-type D-Ala-D-Ala carboxypeptidase (penicillin-binding protein 5/6)